MPELPPVIRIRRDGSWFIELFIGLISFGISVNPCCKLFVHSLLMVLLLWNALPP